MIVYTDKTHEAFQIDEADYEAVSRYFWYIPDGNYVCTHVGKWPDSRPWRLHEFLMGKAPDGLEWDHESRDKLDNRRSNLRLLTRAMNAINNSMRCDNTSGCKGVSRDRRRGGWEAYTSFRGKKVHLGHHATKDQAIEARRAGMLRLYGVDEDGRAA